MMRWLFSLKGDKYIFYNKGTKGKPEGAESSPLQINSDPIQGNWKGIVFNRDIDAALNWDDEFAYFFKGDQYIKLKKGFISAWSQ